LQTGLLRRSPSSTPSGLSRKAPGTLSAPGFEPHLAVSPFPSPSVATTSQYASGTSSHLRSSLASHQHSASGGVGGVSSPQAISGIAAVAPSQRGIFSDAGGAAESLGTVSSTPAARSPSGAITSGGDDGQADDGSGVTRDPLGRQLPAALPSYLKIPTLIPSTYASPPGSLASSPTRQGEMRSAWMDETLHAPTLAPVGAAAAVLNTEDVLFKPGSASKASSPERSSSPAGNGAAPGASDGMSTPAPADQIAAELTAASEVDLEPKDGSQALAAEGADDRPSRSHTPVDPEAEGEATRRERTPTPSSSGAPQALTPRAEPDEPNLDAGSRRRSGDFSDTPSSGSSTRRAGVKVFTGIESGVNTPAFPPIAGTGFGRHQDVPRVPVRGFDVPVQSPSVQEPPTPTRADTARPSDARPTPLTPTPAAPADGRYRPPTGPAMPVTVTWAGGGREVFVTGTFANEWRSKVPLKRSSRKDHSIVLHLEPGTHRLKFIVDDRWRVSRDLPTATDGSGNLVNYIEMAIPDDPDPTEQTHTAAEAAEKRRSGGALAGHGNTMDLREQARRAEAIRRGELEEVFGPNKGEPLRRDQLQQPRLTLDHAAAREEIWTQEIPAAVIAAQEAEEAYRDACEAAAASGRAAPGSKDGPPPPSLPTPPLLPRQLSTVLLNASPANPAVAQATGGTVDDLSLLPAPPNSAILHHLTASAIKNGCVAVGTTIRFKKKYVSTLLYTSSS
jgi:hypothetical protein